MVRDVVCKTCSSVGIPVSSEYAALGNSELTGIRLPWRARDTREAAPGSRPRSCGSCVDRGRNHKGSREGGYTCTTTAECGSRAAGDEHPLHSPPKPDNALN